MKNNQKSIEVDLSVLKIIYQATLPIYYRLNALLEDVVGGVVSLSEIDRSLLLEFCSASSALKILFENHVEEIVDSQEGKKAIMDYQEYATILTLSKTVELSARTVLGGITIQEQ